MKFKGECFECGKTFEYVAKDLEVINRRVTCPHCKDRQIRHPAWDVVI